MISKVSVIVTCYNQECYLAEALNSVLVQTYQDWECIIINDGSTDASEVIAKSYITKDPRFKYIYQENQGVVAARNNAIAASTGKINYPLLYGAYGVIVLVVMQFLNGILKNMIELTFYG